MVMTEALVWSVLYAAVTLYPLLLYFELLFVYSNYSIIIWLVYEESMRLKFSYLPMGQMPIVLPDS